MRSAAALHGISSFSSSACAGAIAVVNKRDANTDALNIAGLVPALPLSSQAILHSFVFEQMEERQSLFDGWRLGRFPLSIYDGRHKLVDCIGPRRIEAVGR
jgi:hypothetical protein